MVRALVIGLGISGKAACALLQKKGYQVTGADAKPSGIFLEGVEIVSETEDLPFSRFDLVVPSPGVSFEHPYYRKAKELGIPLLGEAQLALLELSQPMAAITGTNGKTTVTSLVAHILCSSGRKARALGNIGDPLAEYALHPDPQEILVVELSSYQLETMKGEFFDAAALLNITPDHLDRYKTMQKYAEAKWRLQHCLKKNKKLFVYHTVMEEYGDLNEIGKIEEYGKQASIDEENTRAAFLLAREFGISDKEFFGGLETFKKPSHRIEYLGTIHGVRYYDDSKGTNIDAVLRAVGSMKGSVWLIAGGVDKGASYAVWKEVFAGKVKKIFAIGQAKQKIARETKEFCIVEEMETLEEAVKKAVREAVLDSEGLGNVLLSPGCSSFDMFRDYEHRGQEFQRFVNQLSEGK